MENANVDGPKNGGVSWTCHLHTSADCSMRYTGGSYYHVVPVKNITPIALTFNRHFVQDEFWESFNDVLYVSPFAYSSAINDIVAFNSILAVFSYLDKENLRMRSFDTANDFVKKHFVIDAEGKQVTLCNVHLIKKTGSQKAQTYYTRPSWIQAVLKALFPKIDVHKNGIPTNTPQWAIEMYKFAKTNGSKAKPKDRAVPYDLGNR